MLSLFIISGWDGAFRAPYDGTDLATVAREFLGTRSRWRESKTLLASNQWHRFSQQIPQHNLSQDTKTSENFEQPPQSSPTAQNILKKGSDFTRSGPNNSARGPGGVIDRPGVVTFMVSFDIRFSDAWQPVTNR
ncbi:MAG TPA: hypothetical protein VGZ22_10550, partial [Isosphaeraceae bacterium]|nr:hypothetical protein [Isosphaeraceae bacterium]